MTAHRQTPYAPLEAVQADIDQEVIHYCAERPHPAAISGRPIRLPSIWRFEEAVTDVAWSYTSASAVAHSRTVTLFVWPGLVHCYTVPGLPNTNNVLEHGFGTAR